MTDKEPLRPLNQDGPFVFTPGHYLLIDLPSEPRKPYWVELEGVKPDYTDAFGMIGAFADIAGGKSWSGDMRLTHQTYHEYMIRLTSGRSQSHQRKLLKAVKS